MTSYCIVYKRSIKSGFLIDYVLLYNKIHKTFTQNCNICIAHLVHSPEFPLLSYFSLFWASGIPEKYFLKFLEISRKITHCLRRRLSFFISQTDLLRFFWSLDSKTLSRDVLPEARVCSGSILIVCSELHYVVNDFKFNFHNLWLSLQFF